MVNSSKGNPKKRRIAAPLLMTIGVVVMTIIIAVTVLPQRPLLDTTISRNETRIFPIDSNPYGLSYAEWSERWWQWSLSFPQSNNPMADASGMHCNLGQNDPNVWYLAGTLGGSAERSCTLPEGKAILIPIFNLECSYAESPTMRTEAELRDCATYPTEGLILKAHVDGQEISDLEEYWVHSSLFDLTLPRDNVWGAPEGPTQAVSGGWWLMLEPLSSGSHELYVAGAILDNPTTGTQGFGSEVTYHLTIGA